MRSPILAISLVAAAIATASAQSPPSRDPLLSPTVQGGAGSYHVKTPRQYTPDTSDRGNEPGREYERQRAQAEREHAGGIGDRPPTQHPSDVLPAAAQGEKGGISSSSGAIGENAVEGGGSTATTDGGPASGVRKLNQDIHELTTSPPNSQAEGYSYAFHPSQDPEYTYRMKRLARSNSDALVLRRQISDVVGNVENGGSSSDENSNHDGADGQSIKGKETNGGHSGTPGSSEGGHVYNSPNGDGETEEGENE